MGIEIERKFLVIGDAWRQPNPEHVVQGYLNRDKERTVRVRIAGNRGYLTVKGVSTGISRKEVEAPISAADAQQLLPLCDGPIIEKNRHYVEIGDVTWEVDEFLGENAGLIVAEVELETADQQVALPSWVGQEVSDDPRYFNSSLSEKPYNTWEK